MLNPFGLTDKYNTIVDELNEEYELVENENCENTIETQEIDIDENISNLSTNNNIHSKIEINNKVYYKSNVVSNIIHCNTKLSNKRTTRVFGLRDECFSVDDFENNETLHLEEQVFVTDILVTIFQHKTNDQYFLGLISIDKINYQNNPRQHISFELMKQCQFTGTILDLKRVKDENIIWDGHYGEQLFGIDGGICCVIY